VGLKNLAVKLRIGKFIKLIMLQFLTNRINKMKIGARTAISYIVVMLAVLAFTTVSILLLQDGKNIDLKIQRSISPAISAIKEYQFLIEETGRLCADLSIQQNDAKKTQLKKIHESLYNQQKVTLMGLCEGPELADAKKRIIRADKMFELTLKLEKEFLSILGSDQAYLDAGKMEQAQKLKDSIAQEIGKLRLVLGETSLQAISLFNEFHAKKNANYKNLSYLMVMMIAVIMLLAAVAMFITKITIIKPIKELSAILDEVGEGKIIHFQTNTSREDEIGDMHNSVQKVVKGFKNKEQVANAIGNGDYAIKVPLLSRGDRLGKALSIMRDNLKLSKEIETKNVKSLEAKIITLIKKNKELDQFAYITNHDLKSPLRVINKITERNEEDMSEELSPESKKHFQMLGEKTHRMEANLNSVLQYSKAGKTTENQEKILSKNIVYEVLETCKLSRNMSILVDDSLPYVTANKDDLYKVFNIFISNAINHNLAAEPVVNISYNENSDKITFCIADNGSGISEEFQTIERRDEAEYIGTGLAIGKKIIEEYGGKVWVKSEQNKGAKFYFEWPL
jgi:signal transduction histidine kinase